MARRREWAALSDGYRSRLTKAGIGRAEYESGADLKSARGHRSTPEHPKEAERRPSEFREYRARKSKLIDKEILVITKDGLQMHKLKGKDRDIVAAHWNAMKNWMANRKNNLADFDGRTVRDVTTGQAVELEADPGAIFDLLQDEDTQVPSIYEEPK